MSNQTKEIPPIVHLRIIGFLYLIIIVYRIFAEIGVRSNLVVPGDAGATAANILGSTGLFRLGFVADSIMLLNDVAVAILLFALLRPISQTLSLTAAAYG